MSRRYRAWLRRRARRRFLAWCALAALTVMVLDGHPLLGTVGMLLGWGAFAAFAYLALTGPERRGRHIAGLCAATALTCGLILVLP